MALSVEDIIAITNSKPKKNGTTKIEIKPQLSSASIPEPNRPIRVNKSKRKGNKYENDIAKILGTWMFNDKEALTRSITSGAKKTVYTGDIVPQKQLPNLKAFIWHIECKNGYKTQIPSFNNFTLIEKWLLKCLNETDFNKQPIIWLVCRFHGYSSILLTNCQFQNIMWNLCVNIDHNNMHNFFYTYKLDDLIINNFRHVMALDNTKFNVF
jgi:hypothetical protein